jgi:4-hydroxy-2-oxoheptanedioate aldolase
MLGIFSKTCDSNFVEATGLAGIDFIIIDQEHGIVTSERLLDHVRAAKVSRLNSFVRVPFLNGNYIGKALDSGADGVMVPNISSKEEAKKAVQYAKFYPHGTRGVCRFVKAAQFGTQDKSEYFASENKKTLILQIEGLDGIRSLEDILKVDGIDFIFIGPYDLSQALGLPGDIDSPFVLREIEKIISIARSMNKKVGIFTDSKESLFRYKTLGVEMIAFSVDVNIYINALKSLL